MSVKLDNPSTPEFDAALRAVRLAKAAPDLLKELEKITRAVTRLRVRSPCTKAEMNKFMRVVKARDDALDAIRVARGE